MSELRTGRKVGRTIYLDDKLVGVMDTPELAAQVVSALKQAPPPTDSDRGCAERCAGELGYEESVWIDKLEPIIQAHVQSRVDEAVREIQSAARCEMESRGYCRTHKSWMCFPHKNVQADIRAKIEVLEVVAVQNCLNCLRGVDLAESGQDPNLYRHYHHEWKNSDGIAECYSSELHWRLKELRALLAARDARVNESQT